MPTRSNSFGDTEFYQAKQEIKKRFDKILIALQETVKRNGYAVITVQRFRGCLNIQRVIDVSMLPFYSATPLSKEYNKITCVLSVVSFTMQQYWQFCAGDKEIICVIVAALDDLENYAAKGLKAFKLAKSRSPRGYYLVETK